MSLAGARQFGLGYVADPLPGHEMYKGMLAIPYYRYQKPDATPTAVTVRFRCIAEHDHHSLGHGKYNTQPGDRSRLFNTRALITATDEIAITEGEMDTIAADVLCDLDSVGVPGATAWAPHFKEPFLGYEVVWILADGDDAGKSFANKVAESLPNARILPCPPGDDVNSLVLRDGPGAILERMD